TCMAVLGGLVASGSEGGAVSLWQPPAGPAPAWIAGAVRLDGQIREKPGDGDLYLKRARLLVAARRKEAAMADLARGGGRGSWPLGGDRAGLPQAGGRGAPAAGAYARPLAHPPAATALRGDHFVATARRGRWREAAVDAGKEMGASPDFNNGLMRLTAV